MEAAAEEAVADNADAEGERDTANWQISLPKDRAEAALDEATASDKVADKTAYATDLDVATQQRTLEALHQQQLLLELQIRH